MSFNSSLTQTLQFDDQHFSWSLWKLFFLTITSQDVSVRWDMTLFTCAVILVSIFTIGDPVCPTFAQLHQFASPWQIKGGGSRGGRGATSLELRSQGTWGPQTPSHPRTTLVYNRFYINLSSQSHLTNHLLPRVGQLDQLFCPQLDQGFNKQSITSSVIEM